MAPLLCRSRVAHIPAPGLPMLYRHSGEFGRLWPEFDLDLANSGKLWPRFDGALGLSFLLPSLFRGVSFWPRRCAQAEPSAIPAVRSDPTLRRIDLKPIRAQLFSQPASPVTSRQPRRHGVPVAGAHSAAAGGGEGCREHHYEREEGRGWGLSRCSRIGYVAHRLPLQFPIDAILLTFFVVSRLLALTLVGNSKTSTRRRPQCGPTLTSACNWRSRLGVGRKCTQPARLWAVRQHKLAPKLEP